MGRYPLRLRVSRCVPRTFPRYSLSIPISPSRLDLEGGELAVLEGARATLESCLGLHIEVSFLPIRDEQPLFGDIAKFLAADGIEFIDFVTLLRWGRDAFDGLGQTVFADALFLRAPESLIDSSTGSALNPRTARVYLAILTIYHVRAYAFAIRRAKLCVAPCVRSESRANSGPNRYCLAPMPRGTEG